MNDFEVLSRDGGEPVEPKRDAEESPDAARRIRAELDDLVAELAEAKETIAYLEAKESELVAEKKELARSLADSKIRVDILSQSYEALHTDMKRYVDEDIKAKRELRSQDRDAQRLAERFQAALDAALNDVAIYRRAAFWFGVSSALAVVVAVAALGR